MNPELTPTAIRLLAKIEARDRKPEPDMERVKRAAASFEPPPPPAPKIAKDAGRRHYMKPGHHSKCTGFHQPNFFQ